jgi:alpha-tubulin suppressor-like RCC1 family protein
VEGHVYCWGASSVGQLGTGESATGYPSPVRVASLARAWLTAGSHTAERHCAIDDVGAVACWGRLGGHTADGRPAIASTTPEPVPFLTDLVAVAIGGTHECVLTESGTVSCRGLGLHGELGRPSVALEPRFLVLTTLDDVVSIAAGERHTCAVRSDGDAFCWGDNRHRQLGAESRVSSSTEPLRVALSAPVRTIVAGHAHTCALGEHGNVFCWGDNRRSQLGDGSARPSFGPQVVRTRARVLDIAAGARHTCALLVGGEVQCWGENLAGQLGDGTVEHRAWPVAVLRGEELGERRASRHGAAQRAAPSASASSLGGSGGRA